MSKKIYSRTINHETAGTFIDRIRVEEIDGKQFVTAKSEFGTGRALVNCLPNPVTGVVADLIAGKGEVPYNLES